MQASLEIHKQLKVFEAMVTDFILDVHYHTASASTASTASVARKTYQKVNGRKATMGNEDSCPIVGIGDVRIIMFDGFVRTFSEVLHVPSMNKHLIFFGTLNKEGFVCIGEGGVMKVGKGHNLFLKGLIDDDGLYKLLGSTLVSSVCDATTSTKHSDVDASHDDMNVIPIASNKSMGCMDMVGV